MARIESFTGQQLEAIAKVLADTQKGLTGSQIGTLLSRCGIDDLAAGATKWRRLLAALEARQRQDRCGNAVVAFIRTAMDPVSWSGRAEEFEERRSELNQVLSFCGITLGEDGQLRKTKAARTLTEAEERAGRLRAELRRRKVHSEVLHFCRAELLQDNYFHAVFEATKSVAQKLREMSGLDLDGSELAQRALGLGKAGYPRIAFNSLESETLRSEQRGLMNLTVGMFGTFRNVTAHAPRVAWSMSEEDALDLLSLASLLHRRLENAIVVPQFSP